MSIAENAEILFWPPCLSPGSELFNTRMMEMQVYLVQEHLRVGDVSHWDRPRALRTLDKLAYQIRARRRMLGC